MIPPLCVGRYLLEWRFVPVTSDADSSRDLPHGGGKAGERAERRLRRSPGRALVLFLYATIRLRCVLAFGRLWTRMAFCRRRRVRDKSWLLTRPLLPSAPVYQLSQYYKFGELDSCNQKWSELWKCLRNKARGTPMEDHLPTTSVLWELRTKKEAQEFWEKQFGHLKRTHEAKKGDGRTI